ncbi:MAG: hypothetical protein EOP42_21705 [Sphingobacteriaceae bacterium]|nr:MAG: hypothetical protein EOP42_21705 [Sphingobacteriaceae bacterium]
MASCSNKLTFNTSTVVPAAQGSVKISKDDNGNRELDLSILHLTEPSRLTPSKKYYVIWMETENNGIKNLGQLKSETGFFTSTLKAYFHTVTPFEPKRVFITAENDINITIPGSQTVMITNSK